MNPDLKNKIKKLHGPILILGASGFIGANLMHMLFKIRTDVFGTASQLPSWRLDGIPQENIIATDLLVESNVVNLLDKVEPLSVFDCVSYGAYPFEEDYSLIHRTNINFAIKILEELSEREVKIYIHAGSSSEYGSISAGPTEDSPLLPNSHYSISKIAIGSAIYYMGKSKMLPCANLRLYSVYGPFEDASRLIPTLVIKGLNGKLPKFAQPDISRDFIYIDDACESFVNAAITLKKEHYGESFNIGYGSSISLSEVAELSQKMFGIETKPEFTMPNREWDLKNWYANTEKTSIILGWNARTSFEKGLIKTIEWFKGLEDIASYQKFSKKNGPDIQYSISAIVACYKDELAIPVMYKRLTDVLTRLSIDYEIIFVNDCSPDNSEEIIRKLTFQDRRVIGINHSRNFGSQSAFKSGMELSTKNACVLLDGDLQDPPEIINAFVSKWREGFDVVYGRRVKRNAPWYMQISYKLFYRLFDKLSYLNIPHDAGDFSLMNKRVVRCLLQFPERDLFLRGIRAFIGFKQTGVNYERPERAFGKSTNSFFNNIGWAKKAIFSFSNYPLNILSSISVILVLITIFIALFQITTKLFFPISAPSGITTVILSIMFFGSVNLLAISLIGEYIAKIFEDVKQRPHYLRSSIIRDGEIRNAADVTFKTKNRAK